MFGNLLTGRSIHEKLISGPYCRGICCAALPLTVFPATANGDSAVPNATTSTATAKETEQLTAEDRQLINETLGYEAIPESAAALQSNGDNVDVLDENGDIIPVDIDQQASNVPTIQARSAGDEIKRVVGACLGIDFFGAVGAWEAIESQVNSWDKAAKFVLRRVGLIGAISCGGGVFAEYLL